MNAQSASKNRAAKENSRLRSWSSGQCSRSRYDRHRGRATNSLHDEEESREFDSRRSNRRLRCCPLSFRAIAVTLLYFRILRAPILRCYERSRERAPGRVGDQSANRKDWRVSETSGCGLMKVIALRTTNKFRF